MLSRTLPELATRKRSVFATLSGEVTATAMPSIWEMGRVGGTVSRFTSCSVVKGGLGPVDRRQDNKRQLNLAWAGRDAAPGYPEELAV